MTSFRARLAEPGVIIGDGGWGTMLLRRGLPPGVAPELWTLERPHVIVEVAREYVAAGAEVITTNTFGGSPMRLAHSHLEDELEAINRRGVELVRDAVGTRAFVCASIGPTGRLLAPLGDASREDVERGFAAQARILAEAGADLVCIETMTDLEEALLAIRAVRSVANEIPIIATMTFDVTPRGPFTLMGNSAESAARALAEAGADLVGANCGAGVDDMVEIAEALLAHARVPVALQPNAGLPVRDASGLNYPETPESFAAKLAPVCSRGVKLIGGCCGTTPQHIAALRAALAR